jgi:hypothetical protein
MTSLADDATARTSAAHGTRERGTGWRTEDFKAFGLSQGAATSMLQHGEEEQRRERRHRRRKPTGADRFGALL